MNRKLKRKILSFLVILSMFVLLVISIAFAAWQSGDKFNVGDVRIDSNSYLHGTNATFTGDITTSKMAFHETWSAPAAANTDTIKAVGISSATLISVSTTWATGDFDARQITPRNFKVQVGSSTDGGAYNGAAVGTIVFTGTDSKGQAAVETVAISSNSTAGNVAFASLSSIVCTMTTLGDAGCATPCINIGIADKLGLANDISATSSIYKVLAAGAVEQSGTYTANATYDTIKFSDVPDASNDYEIWYLKY